MWANVAPMAGIPIAYETAEKALQGWASYCAAAPNKCDMAKVAAILSSRAGNVTASDVLALVDRSTFSAHNHLPNVGQCQCKTDSAVLLVEHISRCPDLVLAKCSS